jgi:delta 1-pyrroline-5-carboxylate dehydrogenase
LLVLVGQGADVNACREALVHVLAPGTPARVLAMDEVDVANVLRTALRARDDEIWLVRPDAHLAACLRRPADLAKATLRALALG